MKERFVKNQKRTGTRAQMFDQPTIIFSGEHPIRTTIVQFMAAWNAHEPPIPIPDFGELPGSHAEAAVDSSVFISMVPARIKSHAAMQPMAFDSLIHLQERGTMVEPETRPKDFVEDVDHAGVSEHLPEWLAPRRFEGQGILCEATLTLRAEESLRGMSETSLAILNEMRVPIDSLDSRRNLVRAHHIFEEKKPLKIK
jgi:hypothetical protein